MAVEISLLGELQVSIDGKLVQLPKGMTGRLLLALIADGGRSVPDHVLVDRLWSATPPINALYSLRNQVARLRSILGANVIERTHSGYRIRLDCCDTDIGHFDRGVEQARALLDDAPSEAGVATESALSLVRGPAFHDVREATWAVAVARAVDERVMLAEELWAAARLRSGRVTREISRLRAAANAQPHREIRWVQLIEAQSLSGRGTEALRSAQQARAALAEFGATPGNALLSAERSALQSVGPQGGITPGARRLEALRTTPMVGREEPLRLLREPRPFVWIEAETGHGKTRFLAELANQAHHAGDRVLYIDVDVDRLSVGLQPMADLVREILATGPSGMTLPYDLNQLLGRSTPESWLRAPSEMGRFRVRAYLVDLLMEAASAKPLLILLDDAHLLGPEAAEALVHLMDRTHTDVRYVFTAVPKSGKMETNGPLEAALLRRSVFRVMLGPLDAAEISDLVDLLIPAYDDEHRASLARQVSAASGGDPLTAGELLRYHLEARTGAPPTDGVPPRLTAILANALSGLTTSQHLVVDAVSLFEDTCPINAIPALTGLSVDEIHPALECLRAERIIAPASEGSVSFRLPLMGQLARRHLAPGLEQRMRRRLISSLTGSGGSCRLLVQQLLAIDRPMDAELSLLDDSVIESLADPVRYDPAGKLALARAYMQRVGTARSGPRSAEARLRAATALLAGGAAEEGRSLLDLVVEQGRTLEPSLLADVMLARGPLDTGSPDSHNIAAEAESLLDRLPDTDVARRVQLACWAAHHRMNGGERARAHGLLNRVMPSASTAPQPTWRGLILAVRVQSELLSGGNASRTRDSYHQLRAWAQLTGDVTTHAAALVFAVAIAYIDGTLDDARTAREDLESHLEIMPRPDLRWLADSAGAGLALATGSLSDADRAISAAEQHGRQLQVTAAGSAALMQRTLLMILNGTIGTLAVVLEKSALGPDASSTLLSTYGLASARAGEMNGARRSAKLLADRSDVLGKAGASWPMLAATASELAWLTRSADLAERLWTELRRWSGAGLTIHGVTYFGAADTWLGLLAVLRGQRSAGLRLVESAIAQEQRRGATALEQRATTMHRSIVSEA